MSYLELNYSSKVKSFMLYLLPTDYENNIIFKILAKLMLIAYTVVMLNDFHCPEITTYTKLKTSVFQLWTLYESQVMRIETTIQLCWIKISELVSMVPILGFQSCHFPSVGWSSRRFDKNEGI